MLLAEVWLVNHDLDTLGLDALHDALDAGSAEVIGTGFHDEAVDADDGWLEDGLLRFARNDRRFCPLDDFVGDEVFAGAVGADDGPDEGLGHISVVGQQLLGIFGKAVAAVTKAGIVVMCADAWVEAHAINDLAAFQAVGRGVGVELIEVGHAHGQIGVGEELDGFGFGAVGEQHVYVLLDGPLLQQVR